VKSMTFDEFLDMQSRKSQIESLDENQRDFFEERAAILEFCAGLQRIAAERATLAALLDQQQRPPPDDF